VAVTFPPGEEGATVAVDVTLTDRDDVLRSPSLNFALRYAGNPENNVQPRDVEVDRVVAEIYAERARREAIEHNRRGDFAGSRHVLRATSARIRQYAGSDAKMHQVIDRLEGIEKEFDARLAGRDGSRITLRDARSRQILTAGEPLVPAVDGEDVQLTIDVTIQSFCEAAAQTVFDKFKPTGCVVAIVDVRTGEILGDACRPQS